MNYPEKFDSKLFTYLRKSPILHWALFLLTQKEILNYGIIQMTFVATAYSSGKILLPISLAHALVNSAPA